MAMIRRLSRYRDRSDALLTVAALVLMMSNGFIGHDAPRFSWWAAAGLFLTWLPLTVRASWPRAVLVVVAAADTVHIALLGSSHDAATFVPAATMLALYTVGTRRPARVTWPIALVVAAVELGVASATNPHVATNILYVNWPVVAGALGRLIGERRERIAEAEARVEAAERSKQAEAERQVSDERLRIARDLHDVLAHHITVVNAQAGVAQYLLHTDPQAADKALAGIATNSRAALNELRVTLGLLRTDADPTSPASRAPAPSLERLDDLLAGFVGAGLALTVDVTGEQRPLTGPADLAGYRIVQEALTNAAKHAPGSMVRLQINWGVDQLGLVITTDAAPRAQSPSVGTGTGHGLLGMRERAHSAGGSIDIGATPGGGYRVAAVLPLPAAVSAP